MQKKWCLLSVLVLFGLGACNQEQPVVAVERHYQGDWEYDIGYAGVTKVGQMLYVSGVTAGGASYDEAFKTVYDRVFEILAKFGANGDHIVKEVAYTTDMEAHKKGIEARKAYFSDNKYPAATWVQVERLFDPELLLEVEVIAILPE